MRWECIRRSKEYNDDFARYCATLEKIHKHKDSSSLKTYETEQVLFFAEKYGIACPLSPSLSVWFPKEMGFESGSHKAHMLESYLTALISVGASFWVKGAICLDLDKHPDDYALGEIPTKFESLSNEELKQKTTIKIFVDLDAPLPRIKHEVEGIVKHWQKLRSRVVPKPKLLTKPKLKENIRHLEIYDLKNDGWTPSKLAKKLFPRLYKHNPVYARHRVWRSYYTAEGLIDKGGYKQIR